MYLAQAPHMSAVYRKKEEDRPCHDPGSVQEPRYPDSSVPCALQLVPVLSI